MATARDIITGAARLLGVLRKGEALDADEAADGLSALNALIASWSSGALMGLSRTRDALTLVTASATYAIGTGQTLNTRAPRMILSATISNGGIDYPASIITDEEYENIALKSVGGGITCYLNYNRDYVTDTGTIRLFPIPVGGSVLNLLSEKGLTTITAIGDDVFLPFAGFERALKFNLAVDIAPEYSVTPSQEVIAGAMKSLGAIRLETARNKPISFSAAASGVGNNIFSGWSI